MAPKIYNKKIRIEGQRTIGQLLSQHLLSDKSNRQDLKVIQKLTGISLQAKAKRRPGNKI